MIAEPRTRPLTAEEFEAFAFQPENADRVFEFIAGEPVEVPSNLYSSEIGSRLIFALRLWMLQNSNPGYVTGEAAGYWVAGELYAPDVAYISKVRLPELPHEGFSPLPPDLAIEVVSPTDSERKLRVKISHYLAAGTTVWVWFTDEARVEVHRPGKPVSILGMDGVLEGESILPGFKLPVKDILK